MDICELIGKPVPTPKEAPAQSVVTHAGDVQPITGQLGSTVGNSQYLYSSSHTGGVNVRPNVALPSMDCPTVIVDGVVVNHFIHLFIVILSLNNSKKISSFVRLCW